MADEMQILIRASNLTQQAFATARKDLDSLGGAVGKTNQTLGGMKSALGAVGIAFSATAILGFAKSVFDTASEIHDMASAMGVSVEAAQRFAFAAEQSGASADDVTRAINNLNKEIVDRGLAPALDRIGLAYGTIREMSPEDRFTAVAEALKGVKDPAEQAQLGTLLLGKAWLALAPAIKEGITELGKGTYVMSTDATNTLDAFGDGVSNVGKSVLHFAGEVFGQALIKMRQGLVEAEGDLARFGITFRDTVANAPPMPKLFTGQGARDIGMTGDALADVGKTLDSQRKTLDEASQKAKQHADAIGRIRDELTGKGAIAAAKDMVEALRGSIPVQSLSREAQDKINKTMAEAIDAYKRFGQVAPEAMRRLSIETTRLPDITAMAFDQIGEKVDLSVLKFEDLADRLKVVQGIPFGMRIGEQVDVFIPTVQKAKLNLDELSTSLSQLAQVAKGSFSSIASGLSTIVSGLNTALKAGKTMNEGFALLAGGQTIAGLAGVASGLGAVAAAGVQAGRALGGILGLRTGKLGALLGTNASGRSMVIDFADTFGGFDALHNKLLELGDAGEALWIKLTQGVGRSSPKEAAAAIAAVERAFNESAIAATKAGDAQAAATDVARTAITALDDQIKSLQASIANEAPEEVMGIIEQQTRAQIAAITEQRSAAQAALDATTQAAAAAADEAGQIIDDALAARQFHIRVKVDLEGLPGGAVVGESGFASGTPNMDFVDFQRASRVTLHRREAVIPEAGGPSQLASQIAAALGRQQQTGVGGSGDIVNVYIGNEQLDSRMVKIARKDAARGGLRPRVAAGRSY